MWSSLKQKHQGSSPSLSIFKKRGTQTTINSIFKKSEREDACQEIALFFYNNVILFIVAKREEFKKDACCQTVLDLNHHHTIKLG